MSLGLAKYLMSFGVLTHNTKRQSTKKSKGFPGLKQKKKRSQTKFSLLPPMITTLQVFF